MKLKYSVLICPKLSFGLPLDVPYPKGSSNPKLSLINEDTFSSSLKQFGIIICLTVSLLSTIFLSKITSMLEALSSRIPSALLLIKLLYPLASKSIILNSLEGLGCWLR